MIKIHIGLRYILIDITVCSFWYCFICYSLWYGVIWSSYSVIWSRDRVNCVDIVIGYPCFLGANMRYYRMCSSACSSGVRFLAGVYRMSRNLCPIQWNLSLATTAATAFHFCIKTFVNFTHRMYTSLASTEMTP